MNIYKNSLQLCAFFALLVIASTSQAQPANERNSQLSIAFAAGPDEAPLVTLRADETSAAVILSFVAAKTGAKIIIKQDGAIDFLELKRATLPDAITRIARAAHLELEKTNPYLQTTERIYIIDNPVLRLNMRSSFSRPEFSFKNIPVARVVEVLAKELDIEARVETQNPNQILDVTLLNVNPAEALQAIADAADLEISKEANGYVLRERAVDLKFTAISTAQLFKIFSDQFDLKISLAPGLPDKLINVNLSGMTPVEALMTTAEAANFEISEENGVYFVRERAVTTK